MTLRNTAEFKVDEHVNKTDAKRISYAYVPIVNNDLEKPSHTHPFNYCPAQTPWWLRKVSPKCDTSIAPGSRHVLR